MAPLISVSTSSTRGRVLKVTILAAGAQGTQNVSTSSTRGRVLKVRGGPGHERQHHCFNKLDPW